MHRLTGATRSIVGKARRLVRLDATPDKRRQAFSQEFGHYPPYQEASESEREQFGREVVRPVLTQRAQAVQQSADQRQQEADEAFARAYQVAVDMGLAEKGQTYQDYLGQQEGSAGHVPRA